MQTEIPEELEEPEEMPEITVRVAVQIFLPDVMSEHIQVLAEEEQEAEAVQEGELCLMLNAAP